MSCTTTVGVPAACQRFGVVCLHVPFFKRGRYKTFSFPFSCPVLPVSLSLSSSTWCINSAKNEALVQQAIGFLMLDSVKKYKTGKKVGFLRDKAMGDDLIRDAFKSVGLERSFDIYLLDPYAEEREELLENAKTFLRTDDVQGKPVGAKVKFLRGKGLRDGGWWAVYERGKLLRARDKRRACREEEERMRMRRRKTEEEEQASAAGYKQGEEEGVVGDDEEDSDEDGEDGEEEELDVNLPDYDADKDDVRRAFTMCGMEAAYDTYLGDPRADERSDRIANAVGFLTIKSTLETKYCGAKVSFSLSYSVSSVLPSTLTLAPLV